MKCRHCHAPAELKFCDLATAPPSNAFLGKDELQAPELYFPLRVVVCESCWLVQTEDYAGREKLFTSEYAYFSSYSSTWLEHSRRYVEAMSERFGLDGDSMVCEIAANDGYLLQYFKQRGIPCYGFEPTHNTAEAARAKDIDIVEEFFGVDSAQAQVDLGRQADLMAANNVLAHVPDINDFVSGFARLLKPQGVVTFEFPHLYQLIANKQFDTIYHEHYSYLSLHSISRVFATNGLSVFDVEEHPTHGGSLRVFAQRSDSGNHTVSPEVARIQALETDAGVATPTYYENFQASAEQIKDTFLDYLLACKRQGLKVAAYGAAAKGNTLMNFAGIRSDMIAFVVDKSVAKQGMYTPGSRIPIVAEEVLKEQKPDRVIILPWNLKNEITRDLAYIREWGAKFALFVPGLQEL
jgi:SAM-dependent methyltransferase